MSAGSGFRNWVYPAYVRGLRPRRRRNKRTTDKGRFIQTGAVLCATIGLNTNTSLVYQLFALLLILIIFSRVSVGFSKPNVEVRRRLPRVATAGQPFKYRIDITNLGEQVERDLIVVDHPRVVPPDRSQFHDEREPGEESRNAYDRFIGFHRFVYLQKHNTGISVTPSPVPDISIKERVTVEVEATPIRRGLVRFSHTAIHHPDPISLIHGVTWFDNDESLLVFPKRYQVKVPEVLKGGRHYQPGGINSAHSIGESDEFMSLRDYRDGDSPRRIHWPSTARRNKPVVKEYLDEYFVRQALILDTSTTNPAHLEEAISVAASFSTAMNTADGMLDLIYLTDHPQLVTAGRGTSQTSEQLQALAKLGRSSLPLGYLAQAAVSHSKLISGLIGIFSDWTEEHLTLSNQLRSIGVPCRFYVIVESADSVTLPDGHIALPVIDVQGALLG